MLNQKKALLLIGSPKRKNSTSESLGNYLLDSLEKQGYTCDKLHALTALKGNISEFLEKVNNTDLLIVSFPLYVDSLPAPLIKVFELIEKNRDKKKMDHKQGLVAIVNNGFPEASQNITSLKICKSFAVKNSFTWFGGLAVGGGAIISGKPIDQLGGMTRNIVNALDMAAGAIVKDEAIPNEALELISKKLSPSWLYTLIGNHSWKTQAKQLKTNDQLYAKPYFKG